MVFNQTQPFHLFFGKLNVSGITFERPLHKVIIHLIRKRAEVIGIAHLKANDGDEVCQLRHRATLYLVRLLDGIAVPQAFYGDALGFQLAIQFF